MDCDVVVVGAGLAGLQCARTLARSGLEVQVWEAADEVGGRVRTEVVDGFRLDHGFQVLNPAYPAVRSWVDVPALRLQTFAPGAAVRRDDRLAVLADPRRDPARSLGTLHSGYLRPGELVRLARWLAPALGPVRWLRRGADTTLRGSLDAAGVAGPVRAEVLEPFLAGVLLEEDGSTSAAFARLMVRMFVLGTPGLPADGMQALPRQLAADVTDAVRLGRRVESVRTVTGGVRVSGGDDGSVTARAAVVATDPTSAAGLVPVEPPPMKGLVTHWFATEEAPSDQPLLAIDGRGRSAGRRPGPVLNAAVVSNAAPSYAPDGRHLVQSTCLLGPDGAVASEEDVCRQLGQLFGCSTAGWELLAVHAIPEALPAEPPPLRLRRLVTVGDHVYVCGDHRDTASIQGALVSGNRAGALVAERLGAARSQPHLTIRTRRGAQA